VAIGILVVVIFFFQKWVSSRNTAIPAQFQVEVTSDQKVSDLKVIIEKKKLD